MTRPTQPYVSENIETETIANENFRKVVWTGEYMQLVFMSLLPGEDISFEVHPHVDQFFRIESGKALATVDDIEYVLGEDSVLIVHAGAEHNITNTGEIPLKLYSIYTPPNHIADRIHPSKKDAIADHEDEEFGHHE